MEVDLINERWEGDLSVDTEIPLCYIMASFKNIKEVISLPQRRTAIKALRINHTRRLNNLDIKTDIKKTVKKFRSLIAAKNKEEAAKALPIIYKKFDKAAKRNVLHKNTAARRKSTFTRLLSSTT